MARKGLCLLLGAALLFGASVRVGAAADDDHDKKVLNLLAVQKALREGKDALQRGDYQAAVTVLESRVAYIDGSKEYLDALRDAYIGYIHELKQANRAGDVSTYLRRLECCDPGALMEVNGPRAAVKTAAGPPPAAATPPDEPAAAVKTTEAAAAPDPGARKAHEARALLAKAEKEFTAQHYPEAERLYEQCNRTDPVVGAEGRGRRAYCKVLAVVEAYNHAPPNAPAPPEWEHEVKEALSLAPDNKALDAFGKGLLDKIHGRRGPLRAASPPTGPKICRPTSRSATRRASRGGSGPSARRPTSVSSITRAEKSPNGRPASPRRPALSPPRSGSARRPRPGSRAATFTCTPPPRITAWPRGSRPSWPATRPLNVRAVA